MMANDEHVYVHTYVRTAQTLYPLHNFVVPRGSKTVVTNMILYNIWNTCILSSVKEKQSGTDKITTSNGIRLHETTGQEVRQQEWLSN